MKRAAVIGTPESVLHILKNLDTTEKFKSAAAVFEIFIPDKRNFIRDTASKISLEIRKIKARSILKNVMKKPEHVFFTHYGFNGRLGFEAIAGEFSRDCDVFLIAVDDNKESQADNKSCDYVTTLLDLGISKENIYIIPYYLCEGQVKLIDSNGDLIKACKPVTKIKPVLKYIEYHITDFCNLKCKGCTHMAFDVNKLKFDAPENFRHSLEKLSEKFSNINIIRLMGGEPFLCRDLYKYIDTAREIFPYSKLCVVSNGLLYKNLTPECARSNFSISSYT